MNLLFRLIAVVIASFWGQRIVSPLGFSCIAFRALPTDCDTNLHVNNGRYLTFMDLGRVDLMLRSGLARTIMKRKLAPMISAVEIVYRREIRPFQKFWLETRLLGTSGTEFVLEQRFVVRSRAGEKLVSALALVRAGMYDRKLMCFVPAADLIDFAGHAPGTSPLEGPAVDFVAASSALRHEARTLTPWGQPQKETS